MTLLGMMIPAMSLILAAASAIYIWRSEHKLDRLIASEKSEKLRGQAERETAKRRFLEVKSEKRKSPEAEMLIVSSSDEDSTQHIDVTPKFLRSRNTRTGQFVSVGVVRSFAQKPTALRKHEEAALTAEVVNIEQYNR